MTQLLSPSASLKDLMPANVAVGAMPNSADWRDLPEAERAIVSRAVDKRRREFATGRVLARKLLGEFGLEIQAIGQYQDRTPIWPAGIIGSISHCDDLCVVAVSRSSADIQSLAIDVEPVKALPIEIWEEIARESELAKLAIDESKLAVCMRRLFSAKEATYKCLYPISREMLEFHDLEISFSSDNAIFSAQGKTSRPELNAMVSRVEGRQLELNCYIFSRAVLR